MTNRYQLVCQHLRCQWRIPLTTVIDQNIGPTAFIDIPAA
jgi:hypothetical protein